MLAMVPIGGTTDIGARPVLDCRLGVFGLRSSRNFVNRISSLGGLE